MSYNWKEVEGADWSNRARYNIYVKMRKNNISARRLPMSGVSIKKMYMFMSGQQDITINKIMAIGNALGMEMGEMFHPIPEVRETFQRAYEYATSK